MQTVRGRKADGSVYLDCPECGGEGKFELHPRGVYHCHKCKTSGKKLPWGTVEEVGDRRMTGYEPWLSKRARRYLKSRGLSREQIEELRPHKGPHSDYVYFPCYDFGGRSPNFFVGRRISSVEAGEPKYLFPSRAEAGLGRSQVLWGLHRFTRPPQAVVLCEGVFDALWCRGGVAILGSHLSREQEQLLLHLEPAEITVALDGDARRYAVEILARLSRSTHARLFLGSLPFGLDPADLRGVFPRDRWA